MTIYENFDLISRMTNFIAGLDPELTNYEKVIQVQNFLTMRGKDGDCTGAIELLHHFNSLNFSRAEDVCVKKLEGGRDYILPSSVINGSVVEKAWLHGAVKIVNQALNEIGFATKIDSPPPRKISGGDHYLRVMRSFTFNGLE